MLSELVKPGKRLFVTPVAAISRAENANSLVVDGIFVALQLIATWERGLTPLAREPWLTRFLQTF
jgi:hypothetical protein